MAWAPNDLVSDVDLIAYERTILTQFAALDWHSRRQKALEDWLFPLLEGRGFAPDRLRTRLVPTSAASTVSSVTTDVTSTVATEDGITLSSAFAASTDYLYIGHSEMFRGLSVRVTDAPNAVAGSLLLTLWTDRWQSPADVRNGAQAGNAPFAKGGAITWTMPESLVRRTINGTSAYWARLAVSATPTSGSKLGPVSVIRRSRLCAPVTFRTLALIFREAPTGQDGPWREKADWYEQEAERSWARVASTIGGEFDTDNDDVISVTESGQTADAATGRSGFVWERA